MADVKSITVGDVTYNIKDATARSNYSTLNSTVTQQGSKITGIEGDVQTNTQDITTLKSTVSGHTSSISTLQTDVSGVEGSVGTLTTTVGQHTSQISTINNDIDELNVKIEGAGVPVYSNEDIKFGGGN